MKATLSAWQVTALLCSLMLGAALVLASYIQSRPPVYRYETLTGGGSLGYSYQCLFRLDRNGNAICVATTSRVPTAWGLPDRVYPKLINGGGQ